MKTDQNNEQRYYAMPVLHRWFAVGSVLLLVAILALIYQDHYRPWKHHQRDFHRRDIALTEERLVRLHEEIEARRAMGAAKLQGGGEEIRQDTASMEAEGERVVLPESSADPFADVSEEAPSESTTDPFADVSEEAPSESTTDPFADVSEETPSESTTDPFADVSEEAPSESTTDPFADVAEEAPAESATDPFADVAEVVPADSATDPFADVAEEAPAENATPDAVGGDGVDTAPLEIPEEEPEEDFANRSLAELEREAALLTQKLARHDAELMGWAGRLHKAVRDWPILDLSAPTLNVEQVVVHESPEDLHFTEVPRVDRCATCHMGIDKALFQEEEQPLRSHPRLDLFLAPNSPHPQMDFGCTTCHLGRGRGTEFATTAHTPDDPEQELDWTARWDWAEDPHWETPMLEPPYFEASCLTCHREEQRVPEAPVLNRGLDFMQRAGCHGCHAITRFGELSKPGPSLRGIAAKSTPAWVRAWIADPAAVRPDTWMPHFYPAAKGVDAPTPERIVAETAAMTAYLFNASESGPGEAIGQNGEANNGALLFLSLGCAACHLGPEEAPLESRTGRALDRLHGPHLTGLAEKTHAAWLVAWLKDPAAYDPGTAMPDLRLSDTEAADLAAYLLRPAGGTVAKTVPEVDDALVKTILREHRERQEPAEALDAALASMAPEDARIDLGKRLVAHYGCAGCHDIAGAEENALIGPELSAFADKPIHELDFGHVEIDAHRKSLWLEKKIETPRIFDAYRERSDIDKLRMPHFDFAPEEQRAIITAILGFRRKPEALGLARSLDDQERAVEAGRRLARDNNCMGCHVMDGGGGAIQPTLVRLLRQTRGYADAEAVAMAKVFGPPQLVGEGRKVRSAWLFEFLHAPEIIRPWLEVRMPTYDFTDAERNALGQYFSALEDEAYPFLAGDPPDPESPLYAAGKTLFSKDYFDCASCHIQGDNYPEGEPDRWAPDFALSARRLKPEWVKQWLYDPQALEPGTKMPTYFDPEYFDDAGPEDVLAGDEHKQILALREYLMGITRDTPSRREEDPDAAIVHAADEILKPVMPTEPPAGAPPDAANDSPTAQPDVAPGNQENEETVP